MWPRAVVDRPRIIANKQNVFVFEIGPFPKNMYYYNYIIRL